MKQLVGCGTALITPFHKDGSVDYPTFCKLVQRQIASGINFLVPLGSTGETACLTDIEKVKLLEIAVAEAGGKIPVIAGVGSNNTQSVIDNIKLVAHLKVDGFLIVTPYYNKPTPEGLYNHFKTIAITTDKPIILYNVPSRTGVNLTAATGLRLAAIKNIVAVKEASSNYSQISEIISHAPRNFTVFSGNDNETLSLMATGATGVISVVANIAPKEMCALTQALLKNDLVTARKLHHKLAALCTHCFIETNPIPVKAGMQRMGLVKNVLRPPLYPATKNTVACITETIRNLGLL